MGQTLNLDNLRQSKTPPTGAPEPLPFNLCPCPACGNQVSRTAQTCLACGHFLQAEMAAAQAAAVAKYWQRMTWWCIFCFGLAGILRAMAGG